MADPETQEKVTQLIQALVRKTRSKQLNWEDVSDPDDEMFRTVLSTVGGRGLIRIGRHTDSWKDEEHIPRENIAVRTRLDVKGTSKISRLITPSRFALSLRA